MRQELALDDTGAPLVHAFRDDEGRLTFRYLTVRAGGMGVWIEVPGAGTVALGQGGTPDEGLTERLQGERERLAESIAAGDAERNEAVTGLTQQVEALGEELEETRAELQVRLEEAEELRRQLAAAQKAKPGGQQRARRAAA
jgi:hypothetical protein